MKLLKAELEAESLSGSQAEAPHAELRAALLEVCPGPGGSLPTPRQLSQYLRRIRGRIAPGNLAIVYAGVGCAVTLTKGISGQYQITGFAAKMPGTYTRFAVDPGSAVFGTAVDLSIVVFIIPLDQLQFYGGGFGIIPLNASAVFQGGVLLRIQP